MHDCVQMTNLLQDVEYRGPADEEGELQHFLVATDSASKLEASKVFQKLPTGNLIPGFPAAVMSRCQASRLPNSIISPKVRKG